MPIKSQEDSSQDDEAERENAVTIDLGEGNEAELGAVSMVLDPREKEFASLLRKKYLRAPDPILFAEGLETDRGALPWVSAGASTLALGTSVVLFANGKQDVSLGVGGASLMLVGLTTYLFTR